MSISLETIWGLLLGIALVIFTPWINNYKLSAFKRDVLAHPVLMVFMLAFYLGLAFLLSIGLVRTLFNEFG